MHSIKAFFKPVDLTKGTPWKVMLQFAIPILLSTILGNAFSLINALVLKVTVGGDSVTAINATGPMSSILFNFAYGCTSGFAVLISNRHGKSDEKGVKEVFFTSIWLSLGLAVVVTVIGICIYPTLLNILNIDAKYISKAGDYFQILVCSFAFMLLTNLLGNFLRAMGDSFAPLVISIISTLLNIGLAFLFTGVIKLDTRGVAIATLVANIVNSAITIGYICKKYPYLKPDKGIFHLKKNLFGDLLMLGIPLGLQWSILFIGSFVQSQQVNKFGNGLATKAGSCYSPFESYITVPLSVMSSALLSYVGQNYGAGNIDRIKKGIKQAVLIDIIMYVVMCVVAIPLIPYVPYIFLPANEVNAPGTGEIIKFYSSTYLYCMTPCLILQGLLQLSRSSLQGIKKPIIPFLSGVGELGARIFVCLLIPGWINAQNPLSDASYVGICFSTPLAWFISALIMGGSVIYIIFIKGIDKPKKEVQLIKSESNTVE